MKKSSPLYLYLISVVCFVLSNVLRDKVDFAHGAFLGAGVVFFLFAIYKKFTSK
jgi:hypothetical protein